MNPHAGQRRRNARGSGSRLREELLLAAMRMLDRVPSGNLSLRQVAKEAGVAAPSAYAHFADAEALMAEIVRDCWRQLGNAMSDGVAESGATPLAELQAQVAAYVRYAMDRRSRYQLLFALQPLDVEASRDLPGLVQPAYRQVIDAVERHAATGGRLPVASAPDATMLVLSLVHGRVALAHTAPHRPGNALPAVQQFLGETLARLFG